MRSKIGCKQRTKCFGKQPRQVPLSCLYTAHPPYCVKAEVSKPAFILKPRGMPRLAIRLEHLPHAPQEKVYGGEPDTNCNSSQADGPIMH